MQRPPIHLERRERDELARRLAHELTDLGVEHYRALGPEKLYLRVCDLVGAFCTALAHGGPPSLVAYVGSIAEERICEGFHLEEMQVALGVLEEEAWRILEREAHGEPSWTHLCQVARTIGAAKDEIARIYLAQRQHAESRVEALERQIEELFKGTVSGPSYEEDDELLDGGRASAPPAR